MNPQTTIPPLMTSNNGKDSRKRKGNDLSPSGQASKSAAYDNNNSQDSDMDATEDDWEVAGPSRRTSKASLEVQRQQQSNKRLPAIKLRIRHHCTNSFTNPLELMKEIKRCKTINNSKIKFASLTGNKLTIATDDEETHATLSPEWPSDAFKGGVTKDIPKRLQTTRIVIKGVDPSIETTDIKEQLEEQHLQNVTRVLNKSQQPIALLKATIDKQHLQQVLTTGIFIGFCRFKAEVERKIHQCYKCQQLGHSASNCRNKQACVRCGGDHKHQECKSDKPVCANCGGKHAACSRSCPAIK